MGYCQGLTAAAADKAGEFLGPGRDCDRAERVGSAGNITITETREALATRAEPGQGKLQVINSSPGGRDISVPECVTAPHRRAHAPSGRGET